MSDTVSHPKVKTKPQWLGFGLHAPTHPPERERLNEARRSPQLRSTQLEEPIQPKYAGLTQKIP